MGSGSKYLKSWLVIATLITNASLFTGLVAAMTNRSQTKRDSSTSRVITILHTNDIHGHLEAWQGWEGELAGQTVGGLDRLAARVSELRATLGKDRVLLLDAGDTMETR